MSGVDVDRARLEDAAPRDALLALSARGSLRLPYPGEGETAIRHRRLYELARIWTVSVGRLAEAHTDATAILHEAGRPVDDRRLYGVWASEAPGHAVTVDWVAGKVSGSKPFCSGLGIVDRALVAVRDRDGFDWLIDLDVASSSSVRHDVTGWKTAALADTRTGTVAFVDHPVDGERSVGGPRWYVDRPGFWRGSCGPAACWAGAAAGLADRAEEFAGDDPHRRAQVGALRAATWSLRAMLDHAGRGIDDDATGADARYIALALRHGIERTCTEMLDLFGRAGGPRALTTSAEVAQRFADVQLYVRQHPGERDLHVLADIPRSPRAS